MGVDLSRARAEWAREMRGKGLDPDVLEADAAAALAAMPAVSLAWSTREEFYALRGMDAPVLRKGFPGLEAASKALRKRVADGGASAAAKRRKPRAASARVDSLAESRDAVAVANARLGQLEAENARLRYEVRQLERYGVAS